MTLDVSNLKNKVYLIVSNWGYPFGGGEEFLYQTMEWGYNLDMNVYWISFSHANNKLYDKFEIISNKYGKMLHVPGGFNEKNLYLWMKLLKPDIVHHQGHYRTSFYTPCKMLRTEFLSGFHFWTGAIILDETAKNINILENADKHKVDPDLISLNNSKFCTLYTVSKFVKECITKITNITIPHMIYSGSSIQSCKLKFTGSKPTYVSIINIHKLKGGEILLYLLKSMPNIPFLVVRTEYASEDLDNEIESIIKERNSTGCAQSIFMERVNDPKIIFKQTKIFLAPSLVDETFCRTVNEAMMNGIPVITTGQGNIKHLVGPSETIISINDKELWKKTIEKIYFNNDEYIKASNYSLKQYEEYSESKEIQMFNVVMCDVISKSKEMNIMIISPWCDQGLGIQSRNYYNILKDSGFNLFIFALKPYNGNTCVELQKNPNEWLVDNKYYSPNDREHVSDVELADFVKKYNIGKAIIPETCWSRIFQIAKFLKNQNVKCYAVPNIEIVRKDEIFKHNYFHKILCNNYLCQNIFNNHGLHRTEYIGYGILDENISVKSKSVQNNFKFLFIGGMNAFSRKHILDICDGFSIAYDESKEKNIQLTCTIQNTNLLEMDDKEKIEKYMQHPGIKIIQNHLSYKDIINMYYDHHVSIQVSKHEGLGLGFYEAISTGTPVITLNTQPHNEIILDNVNGWIIPCYYKKMIDNKDPIFDSAYFNPKNLANKISEIASSPENYSLILKSLISDYNFRLSFYLFRSRFIDSVSF